MRIPGRLRQVADLFREMNDLLGRSQSPHQWDVSGKRGLFRHLHAEERLDSSLLNIKPLFLRDPDR